ncbi:MAG: helix-turn-helix transcriptional regulator [Ruminococcus sp.]|nr:helix-turn-helix transcriptional regulator [Ruminococcus sp.]
MIKIHLSRILEEKQMSQAELARQTGIRPSTICCIYNGIAERLNINHIDSICRHLGCNIADLIEYIPENHKS